MVKYLPISIHLTTLNLAIVLFYDGLDIPEITKPWPDVYGAPRRASANSFGFGGTNAHAVLENYDLASTSESTPNPLFTSFVFSARSERSLRAYLLQ